MTETLKPQKKTTKKTTAAKTAVKKKIASKPKITTPQINKKEENILSPLNVIKAWWKGWTQTFVLKGRSSRFELWSFVIINCILTTIIQFKCSYYLTGRFLRDAQLLHYDMTTIDSYITIASTVLYLIFVIPLLPLGSLLIRRMHDTNRLAWPNYLEQLFMTMCTIWALFIALTSQGITEYTNTILLLSICFIVMLYAFGYYCLKFLIVTLFYPGDTIANSYGEPKHTSPDYEAAALKLSCFYFLFLISMAIAYLWPVLR